MSNANIRTAINEALKQLFVFLVTQDHLRIVVYEASSQEPENSE